MERNLCHYSSNKSSVLQINTICFAKNSIFKQTQTDLQIQNSIWEKMQRYGQICIVCYNCETHLPFYDQMWLDFLTNACRQIFSHVFKQIFSQMRAGRFLTCVQTDFLTNAIQTADGAVGQFTQNTGLPFQGIQQTNMSGEQVSFCLTISIINHLA